MRHVTTMTNTAALTQLVPDVQHAVSQAGRLILEAWDRPSTIQHKGRVDLVTETDLAVEASLKTSLGAILPEANFLAEESASEVDREKALSGPCWVIDPLDGTTNFAHRLPFVAISVGLWTEESVGLGIVYNPVLNECFHAVRGGGAFKNGQAIGVTPTKTLQESLVCTGFPYAASEDPEKAKAIAAWIGNVVAQTRGLRRYGAAALDLAYVAAGHYSAFYELGLRPWDVAAGWLLVTEAGGQVAQFLEDRPFTLDAPSILATNGHVHRAMLELLAS